VHNRVLAQVSAVDEGVKNVTDALAHAGLWDRTIFVWTTDNVRRSHVFTPLRALLYVDKRRCFAGTPQRRDRPCRSAAPTIHSRVARVRPNGHPTGVH
jgi:arylsulfatase A-like enzyme